MSSVVSTATAARAYAITHFLAMDTTIDIVPLFNYKSPLDFLISHNSVGPFYAGVSTTVPLWMALYLRKRNLCRLIVPPWMSLENLKSVLESEVANKDTFSEYNVLPFRYKEISRSILQACGVSRSQAHASSEEIPHAEQIRLLLEDISTTRMNKIRRSVYGFSTVNLSDTKPEIINVSGIGSAEINAIKPFLENAFRDHLRLISASNTTRNANNSNDGAEEIPEDNKERNVTATRTNRLRRYVGFL
jgi:GINS complex subunit 2